MGQKCHAPLPTRGEEQGREDNYRHPKLRMSCTKPTTIPSTRTTTVDGGEVPIQTRTHAHAHTHTPIRHTRTECYSPTSTSTQQTPKNLKSNLWLQHCHKIRKPYFLKVALSSREREREGSKRERLLQGTSRRPNQGKNHTTAPLPVTLLNTNPQPNHGCSGIIQE